MNRDDRGAPLFVWGLWAALLVGSLAYVAVFGRNVPYLDDWDMVPVLAGREPANLAWYWSQLNEHRVPFPRLVLLGLYRISGNDFRCGMFADVAILAALAAAVLATARKLRGATAYSDAFVPLALVGLSHYANFLWSWQLTILMPTVQAVLVLLTLLGGGPNPGPGRVVLAGLLLMTLPLGGAPGIAFIPLMAAWLVLWALLTPGRQRALGPLLAALAIGSVVVYQIGFVRPDHLPRLAGPAETARGAAQFLGIGLGMPGATLWPLSGIAAVALAALTAIWLLVVIRRRPEERPRALALLLFLGSTIGLAVGVGWGRAGGGPFAVFEPRYVSLVAPFLCVVYLAWVAYSPRRFDGLVPMILLSMTAVLIWPNVQTALQFGEGYRTQMSRLQADVKAGSPPYVILRRYTPFVNFSQDSLTRYLPMVREARLAGFGSLGPEPAYRVVPVPVEPRSVAGATWQDGTATTTGPEPMLVFALPEPVFVAGIRIHYSHRNETRSAARFQAFWKRDDQPRFDPGQGYANWALSTGEDRETVVWIGETIQQFALRPDDRPSTFRIDAIDLLVPDAAQGRGSTGRGSASR